MKTVIALLFLPVLAMSQKSEVIEGLTKNKAQLYSASLEWVAKKWKSANDVVQSKDPDAGVIVIKGGLVSVPKSVGIPAKGITLTTLTIRVKDNKAKLEFEDTNFKWLSGPIWTTEEEARGAKKQWAKWKDEVLAEINEMIADFKKSVNKQDDF